MIKKRTYAILSALFLGLLESFIYNLFGYQILSFFFVTAILIIGSDLWIMNHGTFKAASALGVRRVLDRSEMKKGDRIRVKIYMQNNSRRTLYVEYFDTLADVFSLSGDYRGFIKMKPGSFVEKEYFLQPEAIGKYKIGPMKFICFDGLGLGYIEFVADQVDMARIGPSSKDIFMQRSERLSNVKFTNGIHFSRRAGQGYNFFGIRMYNESDNMKHVAWNRYNIYGNDELFVKEYEEERQIDVVILIDYSIGSNIGYGGHRLFDFMVTTAINTTYTILKNQDRVGFIILSSNIEIYIPPTSRTDSISKFQSAVSDIRPSGSFDIGMANRFVKNHVKKNAMIFMLLSPNSGKLSNTIAPRDLRSDKQLYVYIISARNFFQPPEDPSLIPFRLSLLEREEREGRANVNTFRRFGMIARSVKSEATLPVMLNDYVTGRDSNRGA